MSNFANFLALLGFTESPVKHRDIIAVPPSLSAAFGFAPFLRRNSILRVFPESSADNNGVKPSSSLASREMPFSRKTFMSEGLPREAASKILSQETAKALKDIKVQIRLKVRINFIFHLIK